MRCFSFFEIGRELGRGRKEHTMSLSAAWTSSDADVPRRKSVFLGFSMALGSRFSRARLERALRGFLGVSMLALLPTDRLKRGEYGGGVHCTEHCCWW